MKEKKKEQVYKKNIFYLKKNYFNFEKSFDVYYHVSIGKQKYRYVKIGNLNNYKCAIWNTYVFYNNVILINKL